MLHVTPFFPPDKGGIANVVLNLCTNLVRNGHNISIVAPKRVNDKAVERVIAEGLEHVVRVDSIYLLGWPYHTLRSVSIPIDLGLRIDSIIRKGNFDIIHVHGHHYPISWIAINSAHKYSIPSVLWVHGMYALNPKVLGGKTKLEGWLNRYLFAKIFAKTNVVIGATKQITDYAKQIAALDTDKFITIPYGTDTSIYKENLMRKKEYRIKYNLRQDSIVLLFVGRFEHVKGIIEFAEATKNITKYMDSKVEVVIVGSGSLETQIRSILDNTEGVHLVTWLPSHQVYEIYIASDIFLLPSKFEAMPLTIIEAMNACLHIVYTPVGGVSEMLHGYLQKTMLTKATAEEIQKKVIMLLENYSSPKDVSSSLSYAQKFDWKDIANTVNQLYQQLSISYEK